MNKFEKKAMARRAYRALVKLGGGKGTTAPQTSTPPKVESKPAGQVNGSKPSFAEMLVGRHPGYRKPKRNPQPSPQNQEKAPQQQQSKPSFTEMLIGRHPGYHKNK